MPTTKTPRGIDLIDDKSEYLEESRQNLSNNFRIIDEGLTNVDKTLQNTVNTINQTFDETKKEINQTLNQKVQEINESLQEQSDRNIDSFNKKQDKQRDITEPYTIRANELMMTSDITIEDELIVEGELYVDGVTKQVLPEDIMDFAQPGEYRDFAMTNPKGRWLFCDGREVSRTEFKELFEAIGTEYGEGNGSTTFNIPDLRGLFRRNIDQGIGMDWLSPRKVGSFQDDAVQDINTQDAPNPALVIYGGANSVGVKGVHTASIMSSAASNNKTGNMALTEGFTRKVAPETVVKNIAVYTCIRY